MRTPQRSVAPASSDSESFLVLKISKRAALFLTIGLIVVAAAIVLRPAQNAPAADDGVTAETATPAEPVRAPASGQGWREPSPATIPTSATDSPKPINGAVSEPERAATAAPPSRPEPAPTPAVTRQVTIYLPYQPTVSSVQPDSSSPDSPPTPQRDDSSSPSSSTPTPDPSSPAPTISRAILNGAGSSLPYPLYSKWFDAFQKLHPDVEFNYQSVGSGAAVKQLLEGTIAFGAVDAPLTDQQLKLAKIPVVHVPSVIGGVVLVYNLPGVRDVQLTPRTLAGIFTGKITSWNDPQVVAHNPGLLSLPAIPITVLHRSDGSAPTQIFTDYLSKVSAEWQHQVGAGSSVNWPVGLGAKGNEGVSTLLKEYHGAIAYVDFQFAMANHMDAALLQNRSGHFVKADLRSLSLAAAASEIPDDFRVWITNAPGDDAYPIASFMWFLTPDSYPSGQETRDFVEFLRWTTRHDPQTVAAKLNYAPLPEELLERVNRAISRIH